LPKKKKKIVNVILLVTRQGRKYLEVVRWWQLGQSFYQSLK
jgi:hypothetical protein